MTRPATLLLNKVNEMRRVHCGLRTPTMASLDLYGRSNFAYDLQEQFRSLDDDDNYLFQIRVGWLSAA